MSDVGTRAVALQEASKLGLGDAELTLKAAKAFDAFLNGGAQVTPAVVSAAGKEPAKPGRKKAATVAATPEPESNPEDDAAAELAETEEDEATDEIPPTLQGAKDAVSLMLAANKRKEAVALLKKFSAASATSVKPKDYAKFIAAAIEIAGPTSDAEDLTA